MTGEGARELWASFPHDPRDPAAASLRASDADRDLVQHVLTDAFADGRLDRDEYDERAAAALRSKTLGELPPLVADLVPERPLLPSRTPLLAASPADLLARAEQSWRDDRRGAFIALVGSAVLFWTIWFAVNWNQSAGGPDWSAFPWPLIINALALINFVRVAASRREIVAGEVRRLERKQAEALARSEGSRRRKDQAG